MTKGKRKNKKQRSKKPFLINLQNNQQEQLCQETKKQKFSQDDQNSSEIKETELKQSEDENYNQLDTNNAELNEQIENQQVVHKQIQTDQFIETYQEEQQSQDEKKKLQTIKAPLAIEVLETIEAFEDPKALKTPEKSQKLYEQNKGFENLTAIEVVQTFQPNQVFQVYRNIKTQQEMFQQKKAWIQEQKGQDSKFQQHQNEFSSYSNKQEQENQLKETVLNYNNPSFIDKLSQSEFATQQKDFQSFDRVVNKKTDIQTKNIYQLQNQSLMLNNLKTQTETSQQKSFSLNKTTSFINDTPQIYTTINSLIKAQSPQINSSFSNQQSGQNHFFSPNQELIQKPSLKQKIKINPAQQIKDKKIQQNIILPVQSKNIIKITLSEQKFDLIPQTNKQFLKKHQNDINQVQNKDGLSKSEDYLKLMQIQLPKQLQIITNKQQKQLEQFQRQKISQISLQSNQLIDYSQPIQQQKQQINQILFNEKQSEQKHLNQILSEQKHLNQIKPLQNIENSPLVQQNKVKQIKLFFQKHSKFVEEVDIDDQDAELNIPQLRNFTQQAHQNQLQEDRAAVQQQRSQQLKTLFTIKEEQAEYLKNTITDKQRNSIIDILNQQLKQSINDSPQRSHSHISVENKYREMQSEEMQSPVLLKIKTTQMDLSSNLLSKQNELFQQKRQKSDNQDFVHELNDQLTNQYTQEAFHLNQIVKEQHFPLTIPNEQQETNSESIMDKNIIDDKSQFQTNLHCQTNKHLQINQTQNYQDDRSQNFKITLPQFSQSAILSPLYGNNLNEMENQQESKKQFYQSQDLLQNQMKQNQTDQLSNSKLNHQIIYKQITPDRFKLFSSDNYVVSSVVRKWNDQVGDTFMGQVRHVNEYESDSQPLISSKQINEEFIQEQRKYQYSSPEQALKTLNSEERKTETFIHQDTIIDLLNQFEDSNNKLEENQVINPSEMQNTSQFNPLADEFVFKKQSIPENLAYSKPIFAKPSDKFRQFINDDSAQRTVQESKKFGIYTVPLKFNANQKNFIKQQQHDYIEIIQKNEKKDEIYQGISLQNQSKDPFSDKIFSIIEPASKLSSPILKPISSELSWKISSDQEKSNASKPSCQPDISTMQDFKKKYQMKSYIFVNHAKTNNNLTPSNQTVSVISLDENSQEKNKPELAIESYKNNDDFALIKNVSRDQNLILIQSEKSFFSTHQPLQKQEENQLKIKFSTVHQEPESKRSKQIIYPDTFNSYSLSANIKNKQQQQVIKKVSKNHLQNYQRQQIKLQKSIYSNQPTTPFPFSNNQPMTISIDHRLVNRFNPKQIESITNSQDSVMPSFIQSHSKLKENNYQNVIQKNYQQESEQKKYKKINNDLQTKINQIQKEEICKIQPQFVGQVLDQETIQPTVPQMQAKLQSPAKRQISSLGFEYSKNYHYQSFMRYASLSNDFEKSIEHQDRKIEFVDKKSLNPSSLTSQSPLINQNNNKHKQQPMTLQKQKPEQIFEIKPQSCELYKRNQNDQQAQGEENKNTHYIRQNKSFNFISQKQQNNRQPIQNLTTNIKNNSKSFNIQQQLLGINNHDFKQKNWNQIHYITPNCNDTQQLYQNFQTGPKSIKYYLKKPISSLQHRQIQPFHLKSTFTNLSRPISPKPFFHLQQEFNLIGGNYRRLGASLQRNIPKNQQSIEEKKQRSKKKRQKICLTLRRDYMKMAEENLEEQIQTKINHGLKYNSNRSASGNKKRFLITEKQQTANGLTRILNEQKQKLQLNQQINLQKNRNQPKIKQVKLAKQAQVALTPLIANKQYKQKKFIDLEKYSQNKQNYIENKNLKHQLDHQQKFMFYENSQQPLQKQKKNNKIEIYQGKNFIDQNETNQANIKVSDFCNQKEKKQKNQINSQINNSSRLLNKFQKSKSSDKPHLTKLLTIGKKPQQIKTQYTPKQSIQNKYQINPLNHQFINKKKNQAMEVEEFKELVRNKIIINKFPITQKQQLVNKIEQNKEKNQIKPILIEQNKNFQDDLSDIEVEETPMNFY